MAYRLITDHKKAVLKAERIVSDYLRTRNLHKTLPLFPRIARRVGLSQSTLKRFFLVYYGQSLYDYYLKRKMYIALHIMLTKNLNVNQIAAKCGYEKVSNFISAFKSVHGFTPGKLK